MPALEVDPHRSQQDIETGLRYITEDEPLSVQAVLALDESRWQPLEGGINLGYTETPHWFRLQLRNPGTETLERFLEITYPLLDYVTLHEVVDGRVIQTLETGDRLSFDHRPVAHRHFVFPLTLPPGERHVVLLRVQTFGSLQVPLALWQEPAFHAASERGIIGQSIYYGILLVMAAFNLFLYFILKDRAYLYYVLVVLSSLLLMSSLHGFNYQYLYPNWPALHDRIIILIVPVCQVMLCLFTMEFLELRENNPRLYRLFQCLVALAGLSTVAGLVLPQKFSTYLSVMLTLPVAGINLGTGLMLWYRGEKSARLFSVAWILLLIGTILTVLNKLGVLPTVFITEHGIPLGGAFQAMLFSFALAERFNREKEARFQAQQQSLEAMRSQREAEELLYRASSHHELTGLPNRLMFERLIQRRLERRQAGETLAVVLLHLRRFDEVNKTLGHHNADDLLRQVAERLNRIVRACPGAVHLEEEGEQSVYAAHVEGVSFAFALASHSPEDLVREINVAAGELTQSIDFMGLSLDLSFMVGCSFAESGDEEPHTLLRQAFIAFDQADQHAGGVAVYEPSMNPYSPRRLTLMTDLRTALESDTLQLHYQPQIHLGTRRVAGFEALLRWSHPEHGFIPPDEFIPMAEQTGLIKPLTRWVLREALTFCHALDRADCDATVAVNISAVNLRESGFAEQVCDLLESNRVAAQRLVLEVTETAAMIDPKSALRVMRALQAASVRLSIDDFGTGHSSLSYIRKLPVQEIKIDRSFVMEMDQNQGDATIVRTTVNMCHDLGYEVVAEGVENEAIQTLLGTLGCDLVQGYHIARPMSAEKALEWLRTCEWQTRVRSRRDLSA